MFYVLAVPGEPLVYPYTLTDLRRAHPQTSFPTTDFDASDWFCFPVQPTEPPAQEGMIAERAMPDQVDGVWHERWVLVPAPPVPVPERVDMAQARLALFQAGLLSQVDAAIDAIPDPTQRETARIEWEYRTTVRRDSQLVAGLGASLGLTDEQIDDLFRLADTL